MPRTTAWRRLKEKGVWGKVPQELLNKGYESGELKLESVAVDATTIEAKKGGKGQRPEL